MFTRQDLAQQGAPDAATECIATVKRPREVQAPTRRKSDHIRGSRNLKRASCVEIGLGLIVFGSPRPRIAASSARRVTPIAERLISRATSDQSTAIAPDSRIAGTARVLRPVRWLISRRLGSGQRIAMRIRAGLASLRGVCDVPSSQGHMVAADRARFHAEKSPAAAPRARQRVSGPLSAPDASVPLPATPRTAAIDG